MIFSISENFFFFFLAGRGSNLEQEPLDPPPSDLLYLSMCLSIYQPGYVQVWICFIYFMEFFMSVDLVGDGGIYPPHFFGKGGWSM